LGEAKLWSGALGSITAHASFTSPIRFNDVMQMGRNTVAPGGAVQGYATDVLLLVSVELFPFRGEPEIPNGGLLELATGEGTKCSCTTDVMDQFMSANVRLHEFNKSYRTNRLQSVYASSSTATAADADTDADPPSEKL
jgi:hypothetical protein